MSKQYSMERSNRGQGKLNHPGNKERQTMRPGWKTKLGPRDTKTTLVQMEMGGWKPGKAEDNGRHAFPPKI